VGSKSRSGRGGKEKQHPCPCRESNLGLSARSLVNILTWAEDGITFFFFWSTGIYIYKVINKQCSLLKKSPGKNGHFR